MTPPLPSVRRSTRWTFLIVSGLCVILVVWALMMLRKGGGEPIPTGKGPMTTTTTTEPKGSDHEAASPLAAVDVQVAKPIRRDVVHSITLPANVAPLYQTTLYAKVSGYLKWIGPDKGDLVKKNEVLAILDAPEVEEQYQQAVADYKIKKITYERLANVWKQTPDVIAKQDVDVAGAAFEGAKHLMEQRVALRDYTKVRAPYAGIITARFADPGALIQVATSSSTGAIPLFTIMDIETVRVYANVPQEDSPTVKSGTPAVLTVKELPTRPFQGAVTRTTHSLDPSTRTLLVEIDLPNPDHALQPGTFGEVRLQLRVSPDALVIPPGAMMSGGKGKSVFIADDGRAKQIPIQTGLSDGRWIEVVQGLNGTEDVVVVGKTKLTEGMPVRVAPYNLPEGTPSVQKFEPRK